jgi:hypothetical protein
MATLESVPVHLSPTRFTVGYYMVEGDTLQMIGPDGEIYSTHTLKPGDNARAIAGVLTKEIRSRMVNPFWDEMKLPETGIA